MRISPNRAVKSRWVIGSFALAALLCLLPQTAPAEVVQDPKRITEEMIHFRHDHLPAGDIILGIGKDAGVRWYRTGALTADTPVQIGSISKGLVGLLFATMIAEGTVSEQTTVADRWPDPDTLDVARPSEPLASTTLGSLAAHTSGLPRVSVGPAGLIRALIQPADPYRGLDVADVLNQASRADIHEPGTFGYSNLGYALLGGLLLQPWEEGVPVADALEAGLNREVLSPNHLPNLRVNTRDGLPPGFAHNGRKSSAWSFEGYAPAGGVVASTQKMMDIASFIASSPETQPVARAVYPRAVLDSDTTVGLGWFTSRLPDGREMIWHNGTTGTFSAFLGVIPEDDMRIISASTAGVPLDSLVWSIAAGEPVASEPDPGSLPIIVVGWGLVIVIMLQMVGAVLGAIYPGARLPWPRQKLGSRDSLLDLAAHLAGMAFCVAVWARVSPAAVYNPTIFRVLLTAIGVTTIAGLAHIYRVQRRWFPLLQRHAGWPAYVGRSASLAFFTAFAICYW